MDALNLPPFEAKLRRNDGKTRIFDPLRQRFVALTPEEWVRQHFVHFMVSELGYKSALMGNEVTLNLNGMKRRCDTVVYDPFMRARMVVEYKRPSVEITQRVFDQICRYDMVLRVDYLVVSNGLTHYCCRIDYERQAYEFLERIPTYAELVPEAIFDENDTQSGHS